MREGVVILPAAERVKLIAGAKQALHHDGIRSCRGHIRRVLTEELEEACRVGRGLYWGYHHFACYPIHAQLITLFSFRSTFTAQLTLLTRG